LRKNDEGLRFRRAKLVPESHWHLHLRAAIFPK